MSAATGTIELPKIFIPLTEDLFTGRYRYRYAHGGRGSGKTQFFAFLAAWAAIILSTAGLTGQILISRQFKNSLDSSSFVEIKAVIYREGLESFFDIGDRYIRTKDKRILFNFIGLDRNLDSIKSNGHIWAVWVDEAETVSLTAFNKLFPTVRNEKIFEGGAPGWFSEIWVTWNPEKPDSAVDQLFRKKELPNAIGVQANWWDNPFFPSVLDQERRTSKIQFPNLYSWIWEGDYLFDGKNAVIRGEWFDACIGAHEKLGIDPRGHVRIGFDIADGDENNSSSHDACAFVVMNGSLLEYGEVWQAGADEMLDSVDRVQNFAEGFQDNVSVVYDAVSMGAFVGSYLSRRGSKRVTWNGYQAGNAPRNPDQIYIAGKTNGKFFKNQKAQDWWRMADRMRNTAEALKYHKMGRDIPYNVSDMLFISPDIPDLIKLKAEMTTLKIKKSADNSRFMVQSKQELAKEGIRSPNYADAAIMSIVNIGGMRVSSSISERLKNGQFGL